MPTYEYECAKCRKDFEIFQSMKDDAFKVCPKERCRQKKWGKGRVKRKLGVGAGFIFKGTGFYITDYKRGAASKQQAAESKAATPAAESKPAAKPASKTET